MFGLVDCNNFFVSCERVFRPDLIGRPVVVLSNNDGCVIAPITVVKPVEVTKEVNKLHNWQVGLMVLGGAAIALGGYKLIKFIKV